MADSCDPDFEKIRVLFVKEGKGKSSFHCVSPHQCYFLKFKPQ